MTLTEVSQYLGLSEKTISNNLKRTQEHLKKQGIVLIKKGCGKKANYEVKEQSYESIRFN